LLWANHKKTAPKGGFQTDDKPLPRSDKRSVIRHFYLQQQAQMVDGAIAYPPYNT
jgi:hypothetical protein